LFELEWQYACQKLAAWRLGHSKRVAELASSLCERHGISSGDGYTAGILHDVARELPGTELLRLARQYGVEVGEVENAEPELLHGPVAAVMVERDLKVKDRQILEAIAHHTLGTPGMGLLAKIVYLADMLEPARNFPGVDALREQAFLDLDRTLAASLKQSIEYVLAKDSLLHPRTVAARNEILLSLNQRREM